MAQQFKVVISGQTLSGAPLAGIKAEVGRVFKLQGEQLERMLSGRPVVVSRSSTQDAAEKLQARLQALDLVARIELLPPEIPPSPAPGPALPEATKSTGSDELFALVSPVAPAAVASQAPPIAAPTTAPEASTPAGGEPSSPEPLAIVIDMVCPKCGEAQPKRTLCRKCGLDMPRFLAAQEAADKEARQERAAELDGRRQMPGSDRRGSDAGGAPAALLGLGFSGRLARLDYFTSWLISILVWLLLILAAVSTGKNALAGLGMFLSSVYGIRCLVLRLHDTGRTGWLSLIVFVPILGGLMALALLFLGGEGDDNEYGPLPLQGGGARAILILVTLLGVSSLAYRSLSQNPEKAMRFMQAMMVGQGQAAAATDDADDEPPNSTGHGPVRYASNNSIDIYVMAGCGSCDQIRTWLDANGLHHTVYAVDSDQRAAERLRSIMAGDGQGRIMLPVLEINGKILPGNPTLDDVHRYLRQASS